jgi:hypothetical protein
MEAAMTTELQREILEDIEAVGVRAQAEFDIAEECRELCGAIVRTLRNGVNGGTFFAGMSAENTDTLIFKIENWEERFRVIERKMGP